MKSRSIRTGALVGGLLSISLIGLSALGAQLAALPFLPWQFFAWLGTVLPDLIVSAAFGLAIAILLLFNFDVDASIVIFGQAMACLFLLLPGMVVGGFFFGTMNKRQAKSDLRAGLLLGGVIGLFLISVSLISVTRLPILLSVCCGLCSCLWDGARHWGIAALICVLF
jgi:ABC-type multidrug transport system permease subunit